MKTVYSFAGALFQTCSGISGFRTLCRHSWGRTVFHVVLMALFCTVLITWGEVSRKKTVLSAAVSVFKTVFGDKVLNTSSGLVPEKDPSTSRYLALPDGGRLWYFPAGKVKCNTDELEKCSYIILWAPRGFATALPKGGGSWTVSSVMPDDDKMLRTRNRTVTAAELSGLILENNERWDFDDFKSFTADELGRTLSGVMVAGFFFQYLLLTLILPFLYTAIFVGMFRLTSGRRYPLTFSFGEFWKIGLYAGFPAMLVASAFPALALPWFSFGSVFMAGLLIYWLYAAGRIERENKEKTQVTENEQQ